MTTWADMPPELCAERIDILEKDRLVLAGIIRAILRDPGLCNRALIVARENGWRE